MDFEQHLKRVAASYESKGYDVIVRPQPDDLPAFAKDFKVELLARRGDITSLVSVKSNLGEVSGHPDMSRYAEIANSQPGWRFDFVVLEGQEPLVSEVRGAPEPSDDELQQVLVDAERLVTEGFVRAAILTAWSGFEAAMRKRMRARGQRAGWESLPRPMLNELYSSGEFSPEEFPLLERLYQLRSQIVHGFGSGAPDSQSVLVLTEAARRLLEESRPAKQSA